MMGLMKQAQAMQQKMADLQAELDTVEVEGAAGGGMVRIRASAKGRIIAVSIDESLLQPSEKTMVEDLVVAALNDARAKADVAASEKMQKVTSGLPMPPGFKF
jgi:DNA-binding YbaB/EbfC family protein